MGLQEDLVEVNRLRKEMVQAYQQEEYSAALEVSQELDQLILKIQKDSPQQDDRQWKQVTLPC